TCLTTLPETTTSLTTNSISKNIHITSSTLNHPYKPSLTSTFVTRTKPPKPPHSKTPKNDNPPPPRVSKTKDKPYIPAITGSLPLATPTATVSLENLPSAIFVQGSLDSTDASSPNFVGMKVKLTPALPWSRICNDSDIPALFANVLPKEITNAISKQNNVKISSDKIIVTQLFRSQNDDIGFVYMKVPKTQSNDIENVLGNTTSPFYKNNKSLFRNLIDPSSIALEDNSVADSQDENLNNSSNGSSNGIGAIIVIAVCGSTLLYAGLTALVVRAYRR
ncbi:7720_t:CDS:2, partial [Racocetra persica]